jgi:divalent metal cation (Fe/Co/Zn/Cd) transporter
MYNWYGIYVSLSIVILMLLLISIIAIFYKFKRTNNVLNKYASTITVIGLCLSNILFFFHFHEILKSLEQLLIENKNDLVSDVLTVKGIQFNYNHLIFEFALVTAFLIVLLFSFSKKRHNKDDI